MVTAVDLREDAQSASTGLDVDPATLLPTPEQDELRAVVREFLSEAASEERVRAELTSELGYNPRTWARLASELGVVGLAIPEHYGGAGYSFAELAVVLEEAGRSLLCAPLLSTTVLAAGALSTAADDEAATRWLPPIAAGELLATITLPDDSGLGCCARRTAGEWVLHGRTAPALEAHTAGLLLVLAETSAGKTLFACPHESAVSTTPVETLDRTRRRAVVSFNGARATPVGPLGSGEDLLARTWDLGRAALAADSVGVCEFALERCVVHVRTREQFGRPIGSFQAIKHRLADLLVEVEAARSVAAYATWAASVDSLQLPAAASAAAAVGADASQLAVEELVQLHGGTGFTWEHPAHLYLRRARSNAVLFGTPAAERTRLARHLQLPGT